MKYRVETRNAAEFSGNRYAYVIAKKTWLGFYWDTDEYFFDYKSAQERCNELNLIEEKQKYLNLH